MQPRIEAAVQVFARPLDSYFAGQKPWQITLKTICCISALILAKNCMLHTDWKRLAAKLVIMIPAVNQELNKQLDTFAEGLEKELFEHEDDIQETLPIKGINYTSRQARIVSEQSTGAKYHSREAIKDVILKAMADNIHANPLHPEMFPEVRRDEASIISMTKNLLKAGANADGHVTSGGTESIMLACRAAKNRGKDLYNITKPEMIIPSSAHTSFSSAAEYFGINLITIPVDKTTNFVLDPKKVKTAVTSNTVLIVASAPCFPYGTIDPIEDISKIVEEYQGRIGFHVDCCVGGFLLPFMQKYAIKPYDFRVKGVTSISSDTHKYGFGPKGGSVIVYRDKAWKKYQMSTDADWAGGIYGKPGITGSRPGYISAATKAVMDYMGVEGYTQSTESIVDLTRNLTQKIKEIDDLEIMGNPQVCIVAFRFKNNLYDVYELKGLMKEKKWNIAELQNPPGLHFCITLVHVDSKNFLENFMKDLTECINQLKSSTATKKKGTAAIYGTMQKVPSGLSWIIPYFLKQFVETYYCVLSQTKPQIWKRPTKDE